ncbi:MAG: Rpn family recombination-promoting nuclease/putative transposase [Gammaproteobacteria bacterium]
MSKESTIITNPHNAAAQSGLADIRVARELFRYYLPSDLLAHIDLGSLKSSPTIFVSKEMKTYTRYLSKKAPK